MNTEKSAIEKMVDWLENRLTKPENVVASVLLELVKTKARRLAAEEKAKPVEATAEGSLEPKTIKVPCPKLVSQGGNGRCVIEGCDMASDEDYNKGKCVIEVPNPRYCPASPAVEELVRNLVAYFGDEDCRLDHHGYCQAHMMEMDCTVKRAKEWLSKYDNAKGGK